MILSFQMVKQSRQYPVIKSPLHTMEDYHVTFTLNDPDFQEEVRPMARQAHNDISEENPIVAAFLEKYALPIQELRRYLLYGRRGEWFPPRPYWRHRQSEENPEEWTFTFSKGAMQSDFDKAYEQFDVERIEKIPELTERRRAPNRPDLIYAIFCQRKVNTPWRGIFAMYQAGGLPKYEGSTTQYSTQKSLESHYNRYRPTS